MRFSFFTLSGREHGFGRDDVAGTMILCPEDSKFLQPTTGAEYCGKLLEVIVKHIDFLCLELTQCSAEILYGLVPLDGC